MSARARIQFFPKVGTDEYPMGTKVLLDSKYSGWSLSTDSYAENGYIQTDLLDTIEEINSTYWVKFKCADGYKFNSVYKTNSGGTSNSGEFDLDDNDRSVTIYPWNTGTANPMYNYVYFDVIEETETDYTVSTDLSNCTCNNNDLYPEGDTVTLTITADDGYIFDEIPKVQFDDGTEILFTLNEECTEGVITFIINSNCTVIGAAIIPKHALHTDLTNCTCNFTDEIPHGTSRVIITANDGYVLNGVVRVTCNTLTTDYTDFRDDDTVCMFMLDVWYGDVYITAQAVRSQEQVSTFTNLYKVNNKILNQLSKARFYDVDSDSSTIGDYGQFITNLMTIPFSLPDDIIGDSGSIQLGCYDSNIQADILLYHTLTVDIGTIQVPEKYNNLYDYKDTECVLHLPYMDDITVPVEYVINRELQVQYKIDLYTGDTTVNLISSFTGEIVLSKTGAIGTQIPFIQQQTNSVVSQIQKHIDNDIRQAYIEVKRNVPYNVFCMFGKPTIDYGRIGDYSGYVQVSDCMISINCTKDEQEEIAQLLRSGVYIAVSSE